VHSIKIIGLFSFLVAGRRHSLPLTSLTNSEWTFGKTSAGSGFIALLKHKSHVWTQLLSHPIAL
jgi:hypothetical protein